MLNDENPLLYRYSQSQKRRPFWKKTLSWCFYPLMMILPMALASGNNSLQLLLVFAHFLYFCGRPLMEAVSTLATEKQRGTYDCLATTGFGVKRWVLTLLRLCTLPRLIEVALFGWLLALIPEEQWRTYGGPQPASAMGIVPVVLYTASCVIFYAAAGLGISARSRTLAKAQLNAALFLGFTLFFAVAVDVLLEEALNFRNGPLLSGIINPSCVTVLFWEGGPSGGRPWTICVCLLGQLALAKWLIVAVQRRLERGESPPIRKSLTNKPGRLPALTSHPILYQSLLRLQGLRHLWLRIAAYPLILISTRFVIPEPGSSHHSRVSEDTFVMAFFAHMVYVTVRATVAGSAAIAEERENRTWESLLSTRLTPLNLLSAQWITRVLPAVVEPLPWTFLWAFFAIPFAGPIQERALICMLSYSLVWTLFVGTLALWNSSRANSAAAALRSTAFALSLLVFGGLLASVMSPGAADTIGFLSPVVGLEACSEDYHRVRALIGLALYASTVPVLLILTYKNIRRWGS